MPVNECRTAAGPHVSRGAPHDDIALERVRAVDFLDVEVREVPHEARDAAPGGVDLHRHGDRVSVVLHEEEDGKLQVGGGVDRLPELSFRGRAVPRAHEHDLIRFHVRLDRVEGVEAGGPGASDAFRAPHRLVELRARRTGGRDEVQGRRTEVRRHLPSARRGILLRPDRAEEHLVRRHAEFEAERAVAVVGEEPVVAGSERASRRDEERLVSGAGDLEEDAVLPLHRDFAVVDRSRRVHRAIHREEILGLEIPPFGAGEGAERALEVVGLVDRGCHVYPVCPASSGRVRVPGLRARDSPRLRRLPQPPPSPPRRRPGGESNRPSGV